MNRDLYADFYDYWHPTANQKEYAFYEYYAKKTPGLILELGCGTGRLLLPLLKARLPIEGVDFSEQMLTICKTKALSQDLSPILHHQKIEELCIPKKYSLIFSALETFQHIQEKEKALDALSLIYSHLEDNGLCIIYLSLPWLYAPHNAHLWRQINKTYIKNELYTLHEKSIHEPIEQCFYHSYRIEKNNECFYEYETTIRWYSAHEFSMMLTNAGFTSITIQSGYVNDGPLDSMIFIAQK